MSAHQIEIPVIFVHCYSQQDKEDGPSGISMAICTYPVEVHWHEDILIYTRQMSISCTCLLALGGANRVALDVSLVTVH